MKAEARAYVEYLKNNFHSLHKEIIPYWHPLGFTSCRILNEPGELNVRLHYWPKSDRRTKNPNWPIHTHAYHLSSLVLGGRVRDIQYDVLSGGEYSVYEVSYYGEDSEISRTSKRVSICEKQNVLRGVGESYVVERGVFHQSEVEYDESSVTLVALSDFVKEPPLVLGKDMLEERFPYDRVPFDQVRFWTVVSDALDA